MLAHQIDIPIDFTGILTLCIYLGIVVLIPDGAMRTLQSFITDAHWPKGSVVKQQQQQGIKIIC